MFAENALGMLGRFGCRRLVLSEAGVGVKRRSKPLARLEHARDCVARKRRGPPRLWPAWAPPATVPTVPQCPRRPVGPGLGGGDEEAGGGPQLFHEPLQHAAQERREGAGVRLLGRRLAAARLRCAAASPGSRGSRRRLSNHTFFPPAIDWCGCPF